MLDPNEISIAHWFPDLEQHKCGYCKSVTGSTSYGMWAESLTVEDYQNLIDRGWRRSGNYCYKPIMNKTCCPQYTIRCDITKFKISKSQKKNIKKFNRYLEDGNLPKGCSSDHQSENESDESMLFLKDRPSVVDIATIAKAKSPKCSAESTNVEATPQTSTFSSEHDPKSCEAVMSRRESVQDKTFKPGLGADPSKPPCKKAKLLRLERRQLKSGMAVDKPTTNEPKGLPELLGEVSKSSKLKLRIKLVLTSDPDLEWEQTKQIEFELYRKYQVTIHSDVPDSCTVKGFTRFLVSSPLKVRLVPLTRTHDHFQQTAQLYAKYQMFVHNDSKADCAEDEFHNFLVKTPLKSVQEGAVRYGSFHQQYWLDDKLIAVGVIDILPKCISSVYFFYDPDYRGLTLGTYGALREIKYTMDLHRLNPAIQFYYMGFYIHSCTKMRYKGKFKPSDLLCPETYKWHSIEACIPKLEASKYSRLNEDPSATDSCICTEEDVNSINIYFNGRFCKYRQYKFRNKYASVFENIGVLIGNKCARSMLIVSPHKN